MSTLSFAVNPELLSTLHLPCRLTASGPPAATFVARPTSASPPPTANYTPSFPSESRMASWFASESWKQGWKYTAGCSRLGGTSKSQRSVCRPRASGSTTRDLPSLAAGRASKTLTGSTETEAVLLRILLNFRPMSSWCCTSASGIHEKSGQKVFASRGLRLAP